MGKKFKNSEEAIKELKKQGWKLDKTSKHLKFIHYLYPGSISIPKKHRYLSDKVESSILKVMKEVEERRENND